MQLFYLHIYIHVGQSSNFPLSASMASDVDCGIACESKVADDEADFFECNICFELAKDPIVTLCGHLYCWPCLYQWLRVHSYSQECPVCKALVEEDKLVPIYGRGKGNHHDPRSRVLPESVSIPNRPVGQRPPRTAPRVDTRRNELNPMGASGRRFENLTMSALFGIVPDIFGLQANGGNVTGVPYMYPTSFHGGFAHGFYHHPSPVEEKHRLLKMLFLMLGVLVILCLICH